MDKMIDKGEAEKLFCYDIRYKINNWLKIAKEMEKSLFNNRWKSTSKRIV